MRTSLGHERATAFLADEFKYRSTADRVIQLVLAQGLADDPLVRQDVARLESGVRTIAANSSRALAAVLRGEDPGGVASVNRLVKSEFEQHMHALALRAAGPRAALGSRAPDAIDSGRWTFGYLMSRATTIGAGTSEIQRNTIAESVLGLPSHRGERQGCRDHSWRSAGGARGGRARIACRARGNLRAKVHVEALVDRKRPIDAVESTVWSALVEFGLPGLAVAESLGGGGARPRLLHAAIEEAAKALAAVPLVSTVAALEVAVRSGAKALVQRISEGATAAFVVPLDDGGWVTSGPTLPEWNGSALTGVVPVVAGAPAPRCSWCWPLEVTVWRWWLWRPGSRCHSAGTSAARPDRHHRHGDVRWCRCGSAGRRFRRAADLAPCPPPCGPGGRGGLSRRGSTGLGDVGSLGE